MKEIRTGAVEIEIETRKHESEKTRKRFGETVPMISCFLILRAFVFSYLRKTGSKALKHENTKKKKKSTKKTSKQIL